jgi:phage terminase large subunit-like protein
MQYDPNTNAWTWFDDAPSFMISQTASVLNSVIYVFGGSTTSMPNFTPSSAVWSFDPTIVNVESQNNNIVPEYFVLDQNYPNPFNPSTKIKYSVPQSSNAVIKVFDILGNKIETLVDEEKQTGTYELTWYAEQLPSGVYFYQLTAGSFVVTKKMLLLR